MTLKKKGMMFVLSSPSGAGKTTLTKKLAKHNNNFSISNPGWLSDRGEIYIKFGRPSSISNSYNDNLRYQLTLLSKSELFLAQHQLKNFPK